MSVRVYPMDCPDNNTIAELVCQQLEGPAVVTIEAHLAECVTCRRLVATLAASSLPILAASAVGTEPGADRPRPSTLLRPGARVGRYQILELLGAGAMGVVYIAHDPELDRRLALKLLHPAWTQDAAGARVQLIAEAQAMAKLRHQNVVAVYDAGTHADLVFVAMELIEGVTLRRWLDEPRPWRDVVRVLAAAGRGLAAAHSLGIVHRDFKPENVLLGANGQVCVSDFGLARLIGAGGDVAGTPSYMAPEQRAGKPPDPRADQYTYCVVLYEALHGKRPRDDGAPNGAAGAVPAWLRALVMRGLEVDPAARHPSVDALLDQIADRTADRSTRARGLILIGAGALLVGSIAIARLAFDSDDARPHCRDFERRLDGIWDAGRREAVQLAFRTTAVPYAEAAILQTRRALDEYAADWVRMRTDACEATHVRGDQSEALLDRRMQCLDRRGAELEALVRTFTSADRDVVARAVVAAHSLSSIDDCATARLSDRPPDPTLVTRSDAWSRIAAARSHVLLGKYRDARAISAQVVVEAHAVGARELEAEALLIEGMAIEKLGDPKAAERAYRDAALLAESVRSDEVAARARIARIKVVTEAGRFDDAAEYVRAGAAALERVGPTPALEELLATHEGILLATVGKFEPARARFQTALGIATKTYGPNHPLVARAHNNLGNAQQSLGSLRASQASFERALEIRRDRLGDAHPDVATSRISLGQTLSYQGHAEPALQQFRAALAILEASLGKDHPKISTALGGIGGELQTLGRHEEALAVHRRALAVQEARGSELELATIHNNIADALDELGRRREAVAEYQIALRLREKVLGPDHPSVGQSLTNLGHTLVGLGRHAEALAALERARVIKTRALGPDHVSLAPTLIGIGLVRLETGDPAAAIRSLERAEAIFGAAEADPTDLAACRFYLARALWDSGRDRVRAMSLARVARDAFASGGEGTRTRVVEVERWLVKTGSRSTSR